MTTWVTTSFAESIQPLSAVQIPRTQAVRFTSESSISIPLNNLQLLAIDATFAGHVSSTSGACRTLS